MGGAGTAGTSDAGDASAVDTTAPTVVSVTPSDGAANIASDAPIVVTFSEAMTQAAAQGAIMVTTQVQGVTTAVVITSYVWNNSGTAVTLTVPLAYATAEVIGGDGDAGTTPAAVQALVARTFSVVVGVAAKDLAGNALAQPKTTSFSTKKRVIHHFVRDSNLTGHQENNAGAYTFLEMGDTSANLEERAYVTFPLQGIPDNVASITKAQITTFVWLLGGTAVAHQGDVHLQSVSFATRAASWAAPTFSDVGVVFSAAAPAQQDAVVHFNVTSAVQADYGDRQARSNRSQFRFQQPQFTAPTDNAGDFIRLYHRDGSDEVVKSAAAAASLGHNSNDFPGWPILTVDYFLQ